jgi:hypothetical protein
MEVTNELIQDGNGYSAKYALLSGGKNKKEYKKVSEMYTDLAIPAGLYVNSNDLENHVISDTKSSGVMPEDLYSKLVLLATPMNKRKKMTRRKKVEKSEKKKGKKKTKRVTFNL